MRIQDYAPLDITDFEGRKVCEDARGKFYFSATPRRLKNMPKLIGNKCDFTDYPVAPDTLEVHAERMHYYDSNVSTQTKRTSIAGTPDYATRKFAFKTEDGKAIYWLEDAALDDKAAELLESIKHEYLLIKIGLKPDVRAVFYGRLLAFGIHPDGNILDFPVNPSDGSRSMYELATRLWHVAEVTDGG